MKIFAKKIVGAALVVFLSLLFAQTVFAVRTDELHDPDTPRTASPDSTVSQSGTPPESSGGTTGSTELGSTRTPPSIPSFFDVNKYLKLPTQRTYVPTNGGAEGDQPSGAVLFVINIIDLLVKLIGGVALVVFIIGALLTILSEGKEDRLEKGKTAMIYAIIGLIVAFFSFVLVTFVQSILF